MLRQYQIHQGDRVEVLKADGKKLVGVLGEADEQGFTLTVTEKVKLEGKKRPELVDRDYRLAFNEVKHTKYLIDFK